MNSKQVHVIVNPVAGNGKGKVVGNEFSGLLLKKGLKDFNIHFTRFSQDATQITGESIDAGAKLIIAIGGDGTIHEVINGFFNGRGIRNPECELGIINCGTGCGLANSLKLPKSLDSQIDVILSGNTGYLDTGRISYFNDQGEQVSRMFVSECQVGIGSLVASRVGKLQKKIGGKLGFGISAVIQAIIMKAPRIEITFDKKKCYIKQIYRNSNR